MTLSKKARKIIVNDQEYAWLVKKLRGHRLSLTIENLRTKKIISIKFFVDGRDDYEDYDPDKYDFPITPQVVKDFIIACA